MGDYSRDTFQLTNVMHQVLTGNAVSDSRHYVGVRMQQAVPLIDADWNELEDIKRIENQINLRNFFGDGIPSDNDGFRIGSVTENNNFTINVGMALASGVLVFNEISNLTYLGQETELGITLPALNAPPAGEREDLIYLDIWHEELGPSGLERIDERLTNPAIGIETARRLERRWVVRVAEGASDLSGIIMEADHYYMPLALVRREAADERIRPAQIFDQRRIDVNVSKYLKIPLYVERAGDFVDSARFADLLEALRVILLDRLEDELLFVTGVTDHARSIVYFALQQITQVCNSGALQAATNSLTNSDALLVLQALVNSQTNFLTALVDHGVVSVVKDQFVTEYITPFIDDVQTAINDNDLLGGYQAQQALNAWLSAAGGTLPEGSVALQFQAVNPAEPLVAGTTYTFFIEINSGINSDQDDEVFDVVAALSSDLWQLNTTTAEITLDNVGGVATSGIVEFEITPNAANLTSEFSVVVSPRRNPTIVSAQLPLNLEIGVQPLTGNVMQYAGPPLNVSNRLELSGAALTSGFGTQVNFAFSNNTVSSHTYTVEWLISLSVGDETGWTPITGAENSNAVIVPAGGLNTLPLSIMGPTGGDVTGNQGTLTVRLIEIDGAPVALPDQEVIDVDFETV